MEVLPVRLGVALGIVWGGCMLSLALFAGKRYGLSFLAAMSKLYLGCGQESLFSKIMCGALGFIDAFVGGWLIGTVYNRLPMKQ